MGEPSKKEPYWKEWVENVAAWARKALPWTLVVAIYRYFQRRLWHSERKREEKDLEVKHYENKEKVRRHNDSLSDRELVDDMLREGREFREPKAGDDSE